MNRYVWLAGRILVASIFLVGSGYKILHWGDTTTLMTDYGLPSAGFFLLLAVAIELAGGAALVIGYRARPVAWALAAYVVVVTVAVHHDWSNPLNAIFTLTNIALLGGLLLVAATPEPVPSVDAFLEKRREESISSPPRAQPAGA